MADILLEKGTFGKGVIVSVRIGKKLVERMAGVLDKEVFRFASAASFVRGAIFHEVLRYEEYHRKVEGIIDPEEPIRTLLTVDDIEAEGAKFIRLPKKYVREESSYTFWEPKESVRQVMAKEQKVKTERDLMDRLMPEEPLVVVPPVGATPEGKNKSLEELLG